MPIGRNGRYRRLCTAIQSNATTVPCESFDDVVAAAKAASTHGILTIENSIGGASTQLLTAARTSAVVPRCWEGPHKCSPLGAKRRTSRGY